MFQRGCKTRALGSRAREIVKLQFHENFRGLARRFFLCEISHQILKEFFQLFFALLERGQIGRESFLRAEGFARTIRFDRPIIDTATEIVEIKTELAKNFNQLRAREALKLAACFNAEFF